MKTLYKIVIPFVFLAAFGLTGCYTVMWSPDTQMPERQDNEDSYYNNPYYGDYYYYYDDPWWYAVIPQGHYKDQPAYLRDTSSSMVNLRNDNSRNGGTTNLPEPPRSTTVTIERAQPSSGSGAATVNRTENTGSKNSASSNSGNNRGSTSNSGNRNSNNDRNTNGRN